MRTVPGLEPGKQLERNLERLGRDKNEVFPRESSTLSACGKVNFVVKGVWETLPPKFASAPLAWRFSTLNLRNATVKIFAYSLLFSYQVVSNSFVMSWIV